jgi:hypothetical protein
LHTLGTRTSLIVMVVFATTTGACGEARVDATRRPVTADALLGHAFVLPAVTPYRDARGSDPRDLTSVCRVVVLTDADCGVASGLAQGWLEELMRDAKRIGAVPKTEWLVVGTAAKAAALFRDAPEGVGPTWLLRDSSNSLAQFVASQGSPQTILVDSKNIVRDVIPGGILPSEAALSRACLGKASARPTSLDSNTDLRVQP